MGQHSLRGIIGYLVTPFTDQSVDVPMLRNLIDRLLQSEVHAIAPLGSTGEAAYLTHDEWALVAAETCQRVDGRLPTIIGIAEVSTAAAVEKARIAEQVGASAIMVLPVSYWSIDDAEIFGHFAAIAEATTLPIMAYNNPATSGTDMSPELICKLFREIDNVEMIKESSGDLNRMKRITELSHGQLPFYNGCNPLAHDAFSLGASGWCTAAANLIPELNLELYRYHQEGDMKAAEATFNKQLPLLECIMLKSLPATVKSGLQSLGVEVGVPRLPLKALPSDAAVRLRDLLATLEYYI